MPTVDEIAMLARHAGLELEPQYLAELAAAYGYVRAMVDRLPKARPRGDEPAHSFVPTRLVSGER
jgi:hypothetical protein